MEEEELEGLLKVLEQHWPLTPAQGRIIRDAIERAFEAEGWELPRATPKRREMPKKRKE